MKTMKQLLFFLGVVSLPWMGWAQEVPTSMNSNGYVSAGLSVQRWTTEGDGDPIQEIVFPVTVFYPLRQRLYLTVSNTPAVATYGESKLTGLSDTWFRTTYVLPGERVMFNVGLGAPTGKTGLTEEEFGISQLLGENVFQFRLPSYGQGLSARVGAGVAYPVEEGYVLGLGVSYVYKFVYHPLDDATVEYRPGNEIGLFVGFGMSLGETGKWNCDVVYMSYAADRLNGEQVYGSGNKLTIHSSLLLGLGETFVRARLCWRQKGKNEYWVGTALEPESKNSNGNQLEADALWEFVGWGGGTLGLVGDVRFYSKNAYGERGATVLGGGVGFRYPLSSRASMHFTLKYLTGTLKSVEDVDVTGIDCFSGLVLVL